MKQSVISLASERISISQVLSKLGVYVGEARGGKQKIYCPFGHLYHSDTGAKKAMIVYYDTNSCHCFAGCGTFTPVKLWAFANDLSLEQAALQILDWVGYAPKTVEERIEEAQQEKLDIQPELLAEALKRFCARTDPEWALHQVDAEVARKLSQCLDLLSTVQTKEDIEKWRRVTKEVMRKILEEKYHV